MISCNRILITIRFAFVTGCTPFEKSFKVLWFMMFLLTLFTRYYL